MSEPPVSKKFEELPPDVKKQAQNFVDFLYQRYVRNEEKKKSTSSSILDSPFFGMWKDRQDMEDSTKWVRKVRKSQWSNQ